MPHPTKDAAGFDRVARTPMPKKWQEHFSDVGLGVTGLQAESKKAHFRHIVNKVLTFMCLCDNRMPYLRDSCVYCRHGFVAQIG